MENADQIFSPAVIISMLPWMLLFAWIAKRLLGIKKPITNFNLHFRSYWICSGTGFSYCHLWVAERAWSFNICLGCDSVCDRIYYGDDRNP